MNIFSIYDTKSQTYGRPFFERNQQTALRSVRMVVNNPTSENQYNKYPQDFELHVIGTYDDETGVLEGHKPEKLCDLSKLKDKEGE